MFSEGGESMIERIIDFMNSLKNRETEYVNWAELDKFYRFCRKNKIKVY